VARDDGRAVGPPALPPQRDGGGQRGSPPAQPHDRARGDRADHRREARPRALAARFLRRVGRAAQEAGDRQGAGGVSTARPYRQGFLRHASMTTLTRYDAVATGVRRTAAAWSVARSTARS